MVVHPPRRACDFQADRVTAAGRHCVQESVARRYSARAGDGTMADAGSEGIDHDRNGSGYVAHLFGTGAKHRHLKASFKMNAFLETCLIIKTIIYTNGQKSNKRYTKGMQSVGSLGL